MYRHKRPAISYPTIKSRRYKDARIIISRFQISSEAIWCSCSVIVASASLIERDEGGGKNFGCVSEDEVGFGFTKSLSEVLTHSAN